MTNHADLIRRVRELADALEVSEQRIGDLETQDIDE